MTTLGTPRHFPSYADQPHAGSPLRLSKGGRSVGCALNNGSKEQAANLPGSATYSAGGMRAIVAFDTEDAGKVASAFGFSPAWLTPATS